MEIAAGDYDELVFTGGIGWGKSWIGDIMLARSIYEISCLINPQRTFGLAFDSEIVLIQQSVNAKLARTVLFDQLGRLLRHSQYFQAAFPMDLSIKTELHFPHAVRVSPIAGNESGGIGQNVIGGILDESNFLPVIEKS